MSDTSKEDEYRVWSEVLQDETERLRAENRHLTDKLAEITGWARYYKKRFEELAIEKAEKVIE